LSLRPTPSYTLKNMERESLCERGCVSVSQCLSLRVCVRGDLCLGCRGRRLKTWLITTQFTTHLPTNFNTHSTTNFTPHLSTHYTTHLPTHFTTHKRVLYCTQTLTLLHTLYHTLYYTSGRSRGRRLRPSCTTRRGTDFLRWGGHLSRVSVFFSSYDHRFSFLLI
jgi:hypothetical protein